MALNAWQKITRVLPGKPFGDGKDGNYSSASIPSITRISCSGTSGNKKLTIASAAFSNGDLVLIHQTRGTGAGQWEINQVSSGGGTTSLTLKVALKYTYTDSGASQAQVVKIPRYKNVTVPSGATWTVPGWDGNVGGILAFACNNILTITGTIDGNGANGLTGTSYTNKGGYRGGYAGAPGGDGAGYQGEGTNGAGSNVNAPSNANGNGAGGGGKNNVVGQHPGGGGGGNGTAGEAGGCPQGGCTTYPGGAGGATAGDSALINMVFGGGGGEGHNGDKNGGNGGGMVFVFADNISTSGLIYCNGGNGVNATSGYGASGGGAGGSILVCGGTVNIGTNKLSTTGGKGGTNGGDPNQGAGGAGGKGRIAVYYGKSLSGSVSSTYYGTLTTEKDTDLVEAQGVGTYWFM